MIRQSQVYLKSHKEMNKHRTTSHDMLTNDLILSMNFYTLKGESLCAHYSLQYKIKVSVTLYDDIAASLHEILEDFEQVFWLQC